MIDLIKNPKLVVFRKGTIMRKNLIGILCFSSLFFLSCWDKDDSPVIETLDGIKITVNSFNEAYDIGVETVSRLVNIEKKNIQEIVSKDIDEVPEQFQQINYQFQKKNFYDHYRQLLMFKIAADKSGFTSRPDIKGILKYNEMQTISQLYIQEQVEKRIKITDKDAEEECKRLRAKNKELAVLPVERCIMIGRGSLKQAESQKILPKVLERVKEGISIKHNDKFDLEQYLGGNKSSKKEEEKAQEPETKSKNKKTK